MASRYGARVDLASRRRLSTRDSRTELGRILVREQSVRARVREVSALAPIRERDRAVRSDLHLHATREERGLELSQGKLDLARTFLDRLIRLPHRVACHDVPRSCVRWENARARKSIPAR